MRIRERTACLSMDIESDLHSSRPHIELFSNPRFLDPFRELINEEQVPITAFLVTRLLHKIPGLIQRVAGLLPIRFEAHSHSHLQREPDSAREISKTMQAFETVLGYPPRGYRAPNGLMSREGLLRLVEAGFRYDSSIFPSVRFDEFAYNNLSLPTEPFLFTTPRPIVEIPVGVIPRIRLVISISYIKLFGFRTYQVLIRALGLPKSVVILCHPYDFTIESCLPRIHGWKRYAHARNAGNSLEILRKLIRTLKTAGYRFDSIDKVVEQLDIDRLPRIDSSILRK